jgi:hypothetical protein
MPLLLLLLLALALSLGGVMVFLVLNWRRRNRRWQTVGCRTSNPGSTLHSTFTPLWRPDCWLAIKSCDVEAVQSALGLRDPKPCSWEQGLEETLFIAPPIKGWILVAGSGLPDPSRDIDACFQFVLDLSRKLGQTQFFCANPILHHHAWVRANDGRVGRAYAWAGRTLWLQGAPTPAEKELEMKCFDYGDPDEGALFDRSDALAANVEKVPQLAARWGLDPQCLDENVLNQQKGIAGEPGRRMG